MFKGFSGFIAALVILLGCSVKPPDETDGPKESLAPCPETPNCVSTQSSDSRHAMPPLPFIGTKDQSKTRIINIIKSMKRSKIIEISDSYIHVQFRTRFFRFVDDVEFLFDDAARIIHFRSASRVGFYDFGVNHRRMSEISKLYAAPEFSGVDKTAIQTGVRF